MKRLKFLTFTICMLSVAASSCHEEKDFRIGISQCSRDDWRSKMNDEINREIMFHNDASVEIRSADDNNEKQISDIRYFADNGFDIIIAAPNEADAITPIIKEVYQRGIPVIIFDRDINDDSYTARIGVDNTELGRSAARYAIRLVGKDLKPVEISGREGSSPAICRHNGFINGLASENIDLLGSGCGNWNHDDAILVADSLLKAHPEANLVYAHNDRMAIAASEVARRLGKDLKIIGIDAAPQIGMRAVADSIIDATFLYPTEGHLLIKTALAILRGEPYDREIAIPSSSAVDRTNADILLLQNQSLKEETDKMALLKSQIDAYWQKHSAQTTLFYAVIAIAVLLFCVIFLLLRSFWQQKRHRQALLQQNRLLEEQRDMQRHLNIQLEEATRSKLVFFTNVSHDLRTPLSLIAEPVEQLAAADNLTSEQKTLTKIADKNVRILKRLINQILDFRKYENGKLEFNPADTDLRQQVTEWAEAFAATARKRDISLTLDFRAEDDYNLAIDSEKMERVFFNLMSNAFKYTPDNGTIRFSCRRENGTVIFSIADSGCGIPPEAIPNIFDRFYQVDRVNPTGSGIGLSLVKAFIELHHGTVSVDSTPGKGTTFTVTIPAVLTGRQAPQIQPKIIPADELAEIEPLTDMPEPEAVDQTLPLVLIIDDNADMRLMINQLLRKEYTVISADSGQKGIRLAAKYTPDLIICDVMMPGMNGFECLRIIKDELSTSHIPVLMLTACSMDEQRVQGYDSGADGYLAKPFSGSVLLSRCKSLIANRKRISDSFKTNHLPSAGIQDSDKNGNHKELPTGDIDDEFYTRFIEIFNSHMSNPDISVDMIASKLGLGRSQFYRKIKSLTNYSPVELIRSLRLRQARSLLTSTDKTVSEIAYEVGFSTPAYFTKCYRDAFGETPSELREKIIGRKP